MGGRNAIGLDIGTSGVRAAELTVTKDGARLERFGQQALPPGAVRDGEVLDVPAVAEALRRLWAQTKFSHRRVILGVANAKVVVRQVDLPWLPAGELRDSLAFQVQDLIPMPVDQVELDFYPLEDVVAASGARMARGLLVAASREMVAAAVAAAEAARLTPVAVDLTSFAVLRAVGTPDALGVSSDSEALVDVGARVTNIVVQQKGAPRFVRILLMGGQDITEAIAERVGVPVPQAEALKAQLDDTSPVLPVAGGEPDAASLETQALARVVDAAMQSFVDEVRGSLDYYQASTGSPPMRRLVLTGGGSRLAGLADRLGRATRLPVALGHPLAGVQLGRAAPGTDEIGYVEPQAAVPVGLALGAIA